MIKLKLDGIYFVFKTRIPTDDYLMNGIPVVITQDGRCWDPHCEPYVYNESEYTDYKGNILLSE